MPVPPLRRIPASPRELPGQALHQEQGVSGRVLELFAERGLLEKPSFLRSSNEDSARARLTEKIRLHPVISPESDIPELIRTRLFGIVRPYTRGTVRWESGAWVEL
jgi:hypothetical protein